MKTFFAATDMSSIVRVGTDAADVAGAIDGQPAFVRVRAALSAGRTSKGRRFLSTIGCAAALIGSAGSLSSPAVAAEPVVNYPSHAIRMIVPFSAGGTTDVLGRVIADGLTRAWKQSVVVENQPGAGGSIGTEELAKSTADGYTLAMVASAHGIQPYILPKTPYDAFADFTFVTLVARIPKVIVAYPGIPANNFQELLKLVKEQPDKYAFFGTSGIGSAAHLTMEWINTRLGTKFVHIPYKGQSAATNDLMGGQIPLAVMDLSSALPLIKAGKGKALAITGETRAPLLPDVETVNETVKGLIVYELYGMLAPKGTPTPIAMKLQKEIHQILASRKIQQRFVHDLGMELVGSSPDEYRATVSADSKRWGEVIRDAHIKID